MPALRDFFGSSCPHCRTDILQPEPSSNRMPGRERAWCPSCKTTFTAEDLSRGTGSGGFLRKLFGGKPNRA